MPDALPDDPRARLLPALAGGALAGVAVAVAAAVGPFAPPPTDEEPTVTAIEVTDRGCRGDLQAFSRTRDGPDGIVEVAGTIETDSPRTELSVSAVRTSPARSALATTRVELRTQEPAGEPRCAGQIAYRVTVRTPGGPAGSRALFTPDGRPVACSGGNSRCAVLLRPDTWPRASTNEGVTGRPGPGWPRGLSRATP